MGAFDFVTLYGIKKDVEEIKETGGGGSGESTVAWRPRVSEDGDLSWTRSSSSTAPDSVNIKGEKGDPGDKGDPGEKGDPGDKGDTGEKGDPGQDGENGKSAYDIWLELGNTGTEEDFLNSLQGEPGEKGADGTMSFEDLTDEQKDSLKGANGKSAYDIWLEKGNTGTEEEFLESLKGVDGKISFDDLTDEQKESLKGADGKSAYQIWLDEGNTGTEEEFLESLKGDGADVEFDDVPTENSVNAVKSDGIFKALGDKQDNIIILEGYKTQVEDGFGNYIINPAPNCTYKELLEMLEQKKRVVLRIYNGTTWIELYPVRNGNSTATYFVSPVWNYDKKIQELNVAFYGSTVGWKIGVKPLVGVPTGGMKGQVLTKISDEDGEVEWSGSSPEPFIIKSSYTDTSEGFVVDTNNTVPVMWSDWYEHYLTGRQIIWELHKNTIDSGDDVIKMYINSIGIYDKGLNVLEAQFTGVGTPTHYNTLNTNQPKYLYVAWFRSGSVAMSTYKKVKRFLINEIPTGGTTGQALVKKSDTNYDVEWANLPDGTDIFVVTCNLTTVDEDNTEVQDLSATFEEIHEACINNKRVVLKAYVVEGEGAYYTLVPSTVLNEQVVFSTSLSTDRHATAGFTIFISTSGAGATFSDLDLDIVSEEIEALKKSVSDGKTLVAGAITGKGIETAADAEFATMAENIDKIESNTPLTLKHSNITNTNFTNTTVCGNGVIVAFRDNLLYCSHDGGVTWKTTSLDMTNATNNCTMVYAEKHDIFIACISGMGIYTSYDGDNWTLRLSSTQANKLYYDTTTGICLAGSTVGTGSSGLWYSVNGYTWSSDSRQAGKKVTYIGGAGGRLYAVIGGASHVSSDGYNWSTITAFSQYAISVIKYEQGLYMACILGVNQNQSWYYSYDGINFTQASVTFTGTTYGVGFNYMKRISTETWVVALYTGIYYTTNRGRAWSVSNLGTSTGNWAFFAYKEKFYAGSCGGPGTTYGGIQYSTDGKTWYATTGISGADFKFYCVNDRLFASCSTGVYLLNSDGISWTQIIDIGDIIYGDNDILITAGGSYSTNGIDWKDIDISNLDITSFNISRVYRCGSNLVVASTTSSNGMFYATLLK